MRYTIFDTPILNPLLQRLSRFGLQQLGWRLEGERPGAPKFVLIAAPHTSNWDLLVMLSVAFAFRVKLFWMGKHTLFRWPLGVLMRWLGGISIDRSASHNMVSQSIALFRTHEHFVLAVPPEGTRSKTRSWKTGFYYIAKGAEVPIALGFIDYRRKTTGVGSVLAPTGDLEADMKTIREFYAGITGKYPEKFSEAVATVKKV